MLKTTKHVAALTALFIGSEVVADTNDEQAHAILVELSSLSEECAKLEPGEAQTEVFGIEIIRVGDTCAVVNGQDLDPKVQAFLQEENLTWAGVGMWVKANGAPD